MKGFIDKAGRVVCVGDLVVYPTAEVGGGRFHMEYGYVHDPCTHLLVQGSEGWEDSKPGLGSKRTIKVRSQALVVPRSCVRPDILKLLDTIKVAVGDL